MKGSELTKAQISQGADVIYAAAGGTGVGVGEAHRRRHRHRAVPRTRGGPFGQDSLDVEDVRAQWTKAPQAPKSMEPDVFGGKPETTLPSA